MLFILSELIFTKL